jgi:hypothetical protein
LEKKEKNINKKIKILIHYVKPDMTPIIPSPPLILSLLEGDVIPTPHK